MGALGPYRSHAHAGFDADLRHAGKANEILTDQISCMGCLSACGFQLVAERAGTTGRKADPGYCIRRRCGNQPTDRTEDRLMFAGHNAYRFKDDPFLRQRLRSHREAAGGADRDRVEATPPDRRPATKGNYVLFTT